MIEAAQTYGQVFECSCVRTAYVLRTYCVPPHSDHLRVVTNSVDCYRCFKFCVSISKTTAQPTKVLQSTYNRVAVLHLCRDDSVYS